MLFRSEPDGELAIKVNVAQIAAYLTELNADVDGIAVELLRGKRPMLPSLSHGFLVWRLTGIGFQPFAW